MNLIQQFPDISGKIRAKIRIASRTSRTANSNQQSTCSEAEAVVKHYEGEFKKWHFKFIFILVTTIAVVYSMLLNGVWILDHISLPTLH